MRLYPVLALMLVVASCAGPSRHSASHVQVFHAGHGTGYGDFAVGPFENPPKEIVVVFDGCPPTSNFAMWNNKVTLRWKGDHTTLYQRPPDAPHLERLISKDPMGKYLEIRRFGNEVHMVFLQQAIPLFSEKSWIGWGIPK